MAHPYMTKLEEKIVGKVIDDALLGGFTLSVFDGEEFTLKESRDKKKIIEALASSCQDYLYFVDSSSKKVGWVRLIWGNDCDVISDNTVNLNKYLVNAEKIANGE